MAWNLQTEMRLLPEACETALQTAPWTMPGGGKGQGGWRSQTENPGHHKMGKDCSFWWRLNFALDKHIQGQSIRKVQVEDGTGGILEFNTQEGVQNAIFNEVHWKRYNLVKEASICKGSLRGQFGYKSTLPTAWLVLEGSYNYPPDIDEATKELFEECA
jgi:hypothetical protein